VARPKRQPTRGRAGASAADDPRPTTQIEREARATDVDDDAFRPGIRHTDGGTRTAEQSDMSGHRGQCDGWARRARARCDGHERKRYKDGRDAREDVNHRPMTVNVTVAV
jgi:hypothetical protein